MNTINILFMILNISILIYIVNHIRTKKRIHNLIEIIFLIIYASLTLILLFPQILTSIENFFNIPSAINLIIYSSIFLAYAFIFSLYERLETQREEITKLNRELALTNNKLKKQNK